MLYAMNADEVFRIGVEIETNGKKFYETVASMMKDPVVAGIFGELAKWENHHIEIFENLRLRLPAEARLGDLFDPDGEEGGYIKDAADNHIFVKNSDIAALAAKADTPDKAFEIALTFEKDSVIFYTAMKKLIPPHLGQDKVDLLIEEEVKHVAILNKYREKTYKAG